MPALTLFSCSGRCRFDVFNELTHIYETGKYMHMFMKFNKLIPELSVSDINRSIEFYTKILGFKIKYSREESKFAFLSFHGSQLMIEKINDRWETAKAEYPFGRGINFQIDVKNIDVLIKSLEKHNYPIKIMPQENWYRVGNKLHGNREFLVVDPDGYLLRFSKDLGTKPIKSDQNKFRRP